MKNVMTGALRSKRTSVDESTGVTKIYDSIVISVQEYKRSLGNDKYSHGLVTQFEFVDAVKDGNPVKRPVPVTDIRIPIHKFYSLTGVMPQDFLKNFKRLYQNHQMVISYKDGRFGKEMSSIEISDETYEILQKRLEAERAAYSEDFDETEYEDFDESEEASELEDIPVPFVDSSEDSTEIDPYEENALSSVDKDAELKIQKKGLFKR